MGAQAPDPGVGSVMTRRKFSGSMLLTAAAASDLATHCFGGVASAVAGVIRTDRGRPTITHGVQSGDVTEGIAVVWARTDRPARIEVTWSTRSDFQGAQTERGVAATPESDFTAKMVLMDLPAGQTIFYRIRFQDLSDLKAWSTPESGRFKTPALDRRNIRFIWSGDTAGQGYGINPEIGGMPMYATMARFEPDFFIHSGDLVYADNPIQPELVLPDGSTWRNVTTEAKSKVAESLNEFRGNYQYNLMDVNVRGFNACTPGLYQWDDHEVLNNWSPGREVEDPRYTIRSMDLLASRGYRAFREYTPISIIAADPERIYRSFSYGPSLEIFRIDMRSYRGSNSANQQSEIAPDSAFLGPKQLRWLMDALTQSKATWKVIAADMPVGLIVRDGVDRFENYANGDGLPCGRELELAQLLRFIKERDLKNIVWVTADVHYAAAHMYDPVRAQFTEFKPFWEFVAGPLHAGTFGPEDLDNTFGPEVKFNSLAGPKVKNLAPSEGRQFFGLVDIDGQTESMRIALHNLKGEEIFHTILLPER